MVESRLQGFLDLTDKAVTDMLSQLPALLGYQSEQLQAMREGLGGLAGLPGADVASLLQKEPRILGYSWPGVPSRRRSPSSRPAMHVPTSMPAGSDELNVSLRIISKFEVTDEYYIFACCRTILMCPVRVLMQEPPLMLLTS